MTGAVTVLKRVLKRPMVQFFLFGAGVFVAYGISAQNVEHMRRAPGEVIAVDVGLVPQFQARFQNSTQTAATAEDMQLMLEQWVREEIEVREARGLGLDQNDTIVRQRLVQKMRFLTQAAAQSAVPDPDALRAYFDAHAAEYAHPPTVSFQQVFLGGSVSPDILDIVLDQLQGGADPAETGSRTMLPVELSLATPAQVENVFGRGFFAPISGLSVGDWQGPIESTFGQHLVNVAQTTQATAAVYADVQDRVLADWQRAQSAILAEDMHREMAQRYVVEMPSPEAIERAMSQ